MSFMRWVRGAALLLAAAAVCGASAQVVDDPCKNHYILSVDDGKSYENTKCQAEAPPDDVTSTPSSPPPPPADGGPSLRITQIYSSMDGSTQYVELTEYAGRNDQQRIAGLTLTSTANGVTKTFVFPHDLSSTQTANASYVVAISDFESQSSELPSLYQNTGCCVGFREADFAMPERFLSVDGGTLSFAGADTWTYPALPTDGSTALYRDGSTRPAVLKNGELHCPTPTGDLCASNITVSAPLVGAIEYRNMFDDRRYVTAAADAIDTIDQGRSPGWVRTGLELAVGATATTHLGLEYTYVGSPVCRFRIPTSEGVGYFYSLAQDECAAAAREPGAVLETAAAFYAQTPDWTSGKCAPLPGFIDGDIPLTPVYRLSSPLSAFDTRLTTDATMRDALVAAGWQRSGFGPDGTALCVY
ncbi:MAG TPA: hypothetical protein VIH36_15630 [Casimicrobiaceae bacterium]